jgi:antitoxin ParD1/3/4
MNVSLGQKWDQFVASKVESGDFQTASEVLREGLRLLEKEELLKKSRTHRCLNLKQNY